MRAVEVTTATIGNNGNSKSETNDDDGTGDEGLNGLMSLEPNSGRSPKVSRHQSTQGQKEKESDEA